MLWTNKIRLCLSKTFCKSLISDIITLSKCNRPAVSINNHRLPRNLASSNAWLASAIGSLSLDSKKCIPSSLANVLNWSWDAGL